MFLMQVLWSEGDEEGIVCIDLRPNLALILSRFGQLSC